MGQSAEKLLREYVREVLKEDDGGVYMDLAMADATQNPWGVSFGSGEQLANIFIKPFTDVVQTAIGKTKELSQKGQTLVKVAFETVATTLIPILTDSYNEIFAKEKERMDKIRQQYGEVYQANWDAFKDNDVQLVTFLYDPARFVLGKLLKQSPAVAMGLISTVTGGTIDKWLDHVKEEYGVGKEGEPPRTGLERGGGKHKKNIEDIIPGGGGGYDVGWGAMEGVVREDAQQEKPPLEQVLSNPKVVAAINNSKLAQQMRKQGEAAVREPLTQVFKQAQAVLKAQSVQDLQQKLGKRIKGAEQLQKVDPKARQAAEQTLMAGVKKSMKAFYIKSLEQQAKKLEGSPAVKDYQSVIGKIKAL
jgi:hypothetical protein